MCGIIGITSLQGNFREPIGKVVRRCLERLEYRGYDSVGIAVIKGSSIEVRKGKGKIAEVSVRLSFDEVDGLTAIGHTRWATHGKPSDENAHPHTDCTGRVAVVHNGIISNFLELKEELIRKGHVFRSETDTEVLAHLIEEYLRMGYKPFDAFKAALSKIRGAYAFVVAMAQEPNRLYFARNTSPLVIGIGNGANFIASDIPAFLEFTNTVIVLRQVPRRAAGHKRDGTLCLRLIALDEQGVAGRLGYPPPVVDDEQGRYGAYGGHDPPGQVRRQIGCGQQANCYSCGYSNALHRENQGDHPAPVPGGGVLASYR